MDIRPDEIRVYREWRLETNKTTCEGCGYEFKEYELQHTVLDCLQELQRRLKLVEGK